MKRLYIALLLISCLIFSCSTGDSLSNGAVSQAGAGLTINQFAETTADSSLTVAGTVDRGATVAIVTDTAASDGDAAIADTMWSYTISGLVEGENRVTITAKDPSGLSTRLNLTVTRNSEVPKLTLDQPGFLTSADTEVITGTVADGVTVSVETDTAASDGVADIVAGNWRFVITGLVEGWNQVRIIAKDANGSIAVANAMIIRDTQPPAVNLNLISEVTPQRDIIISGTVESGANVFIESDTPASDGFATITGVGWKYTINGLVEGENRITVTARDAAGNISQVVTLVTFRFFEIIAHRGSSRTAPENTMSAFNLAWQQEADAVELDVYLSKDNRIMVIHDPTTGRTAGTDLVVKDTTSEVLRTLDVGSFKGKQFAGQRIPFLEEVIETIPPGKRIFIDIKTGPEMLPFLQQVIVGSGKKGQIAVHSFNLTNLTEFKKLMPDISSIYGTATISNAEQLIQTVTINGLDGINIEPHIATLPFISIVNASNLKVYAWGINAVSTANNMFKYGVNGIITDAPDIIINAIR